MGWFELKKSGDQYRFTLEAGNGETILTSESYTTLAAAKNGIESVQANSSNAERYAQEVATNGKFYFNLKAGNHQIIGTSQMYTTKEARDKGVASVAANGSSTTIKDLTI